VTALTFRNEVVHTFARITQSEAALLRFYQFSNLPLSYSAHDFVVIITSTIVIATLAAFCRRGVQRDSNPWRPCAVNRPALPRNRLDGGFSPASSNHV